MSYRKSSKIHWEKQVQYTEGWIILMYMRLHVQNIILEEYVRNQGEGLETGVMVTSKRITRTEAYKNVGSFFKKKNVRLWLQDEFRGSAGPLVRTWSLSCPDHGKSTAAMSRGGRTFENCQKLEPFYLFEINIFAKVVLERELMRWPSFLINLSSRNQIYNKKIVKTVTAATLIHILPISLAKIKKFKNTQLMRARGVIHCCNLV